MLKAELSPGLHKPFPARVWEQQDPGTQTRLVRSRQHRCTARMNPVQASELSNPEEVPRPVTRELHLRNSASHTPRPPATRHVHWPHAMSTLPSTHHVHRPCATSTSHAPHPLAMCHIHRPHTMSTGHSPRPPATHHVHQQHTMSTGHVPHPPASHTPHPPAMCHAHQPHATSTSYTPCPPATHHVHGVKHRSHKDASPGADKASTPEARDRRIPSTQQRTLALPRGHPRGQEPGRLGSGSFYSQVPGRVTRKGQHRHPDWKGTHEVTSAGDVVLRTTHCETPSEHRTHHSFNAKHHVLHG